MTAIRIIDDHLELANIGTKTHAQIEGHIQGIGNYAFPVADGAVNKILQTNGAGVLSWVSLPAGFACGDLNACDLTDIGTRAHSSLTGIGVSDHHTDHQVASAEDANFKSMNIATGEAYKQNSQNLLRFKATDNLIIGINAGAALSALSSGYANTLIGVSAGKRINTGYGNLCLGTGSGEYLTGGRHNTLLGLSTGFRMTSAEYNIAIGRDSGYNITTGKRNTLIGTSAGKNMSTSEKNVCIGYGAGYYETGSNKLYIASHITAALTLIHGEFDNKHLFFKGAAVAPIDAKLHNSDITFWTDEVNDQLEIKVKKSDGTIITGNVQLV